MWDGGVRGWRLEVGDCSEMRMAGGWRSKVRDQSRGAYAG